jgi:S-formylglutathione hydrolase FrmB
MLHWVLALRIDRASFLVPLDIVAAALALFLLVRSPLPRSLFRTVVAAAVGGAAGLFATWLLGDVWNVFGVELTAITRMWVALACAGVALAIANLWRSRWWRTALAAVAIPVFVLAGGAGVNVDFGAYRTFSDALEIAPYPAISNAGLSGHQAAADPAAWAQWHPPAGMPTHGRVGTVRIPATRSGFPARPASVYLPPAALEPGAPALPVLVLLSGQPGAPADMFTSGRTAAVLDSYAATHRGLAPIVVAPDQLGAPDHNPMCVDSPLGNSATYITVDVPRWIRTHLHVASEPRYWAIGGFSQGGTCAIQFGAAHPELFRTILDISGELAPTIGADTVRRGFGGSIARYDAAKPVNILAAHAPYRGVTAIFGVGANDARYVRNESVVKAAAARAGMATVEITSPGTAHDWNTVRYVLERSLPMLSDRLGLG